MQGKGNMKAWLIFVAPLLVTLHMCLAQSDSLTSSLKLSASSSYDILESSSTVPATMHPTISSGMHPETSSRTHDMASSIVHPRGSSRTHDMASSSMHPETSSSGPARVPSSRHATAHMPSSSLHEDAPSSGKILAHSSSMASSSKHSSSAFSKPGSPLSPSVTPSSASARDSASTTISITASTAVQVPTVMPLTEQGSKKYVFSFKITNRVCTLNIRENNAKSTEYQSIATVILKAVNDAFKSDPLYRGSKILYFECGSVIAAVEVSKNGSATSNVGKELKPASDLVKTGSISGLILDASSFTSNPTKQSPNIFVKMVTKLSNQQFCMHRANFKDRFASFIVATDGLSVISASQIVIFDHACNEASKYGAAKASFYITSSAGDAISPDQELTVRSYKLIKQFIGDITTWRLSASFDDKVESVELAGKDKVEETTFEELTIVLIGMGVTFGLLLLIIIIILVIIRLRRRKVKNRAAAVTIENKSYGKDNPEYNQSSTHGSNGRVEINIDGHDYEYPSAPGQKRNIEPAADAYQELQPQSKQKTPPPKYQTLSADEELGTKVTVGPEDSAGFSSPVLAFDPGAKGLTVAELAEWKDNNDQMKLEFESLEYDMPSSNMYPSSLQDKNRMPNVIPRPESRVPLLKQGDDSDSDYINANYVMDNNLEKKYIITQGPLQHTVDDFWRMIVEQNVRVVVMVTPLAQEGSEKCSQYWPPDSTPRKYGEIEVNLSKKELKPDFTVTTMKLTTKDQEREVVLFRYMTWPEKDVPENVKSFVNFLLEARAANKAIGDSAIVMHCSSGIGVSAVFAAISNGIDSLNDERSVDIYGIAKGLRKDRAGAIQHFDQYKFVYQALYEYTLKIQSNGTPFANQSNATSSF